MAPLRDQIRYAPLPSWLVDARKPHYLRCTMTYQPIQVPANTDEKFVRERIDPLLRDVHAMLRLPLSGTPGLDTDCTLPAAMVLFNLIDGVSKELYRDPRELEGRNSMYRSSKARFEHVLEDHFPWEPELKLDGAILRLDAAKCLYRGYRTALSHHLGHIYNPKYVDLGVFRIGKQSMSEDEIVRIEQADQRLPEWTIPTLRLIQYADGREGRKLKLKCFYWGVREMIRRVLQVRAQMEPHDTNQAATEVTASAPQSKMKADTAIEHGLPADYE